MKAVILAGGFGTRISEDRTSSQPMIEMRRQTDFVAPS